MSDPILEVAAQALRESVGMSQYGRAEVILAAVTPLIEEAYVRSRATIHVAAIRNAALEEAAQVAEKDVEWGGLIHAATSKAIAAAIRSLKDPLP